MSSPIQPFSERAFYLTEFRRRSIGIAWPAEEPFEPEPLARVLEALIENQTRVIVLSPSVEVFEAVGDATPVDITEPDFAPRLWRRLRAAGVVGLRVSPTDFAGDCERAALRLRLAKLVWIQSEPPVLRATPSQEGPRVSMVDLEHLGPLLGESAAPHDAAMTARPGRRPLLAAIRAMITGGIPAVNVCAAKELEQELFTYAGAGIFFTRDRYADVRPLALDEFDAASDLMMRGEADGYLAPRDEVSRDAILAHGVGVFIEGRYLAGIGAILPYAEEGAAEIAALYALTRYAGEGAGSHIVRFAIGRARCEGLAYLFACTTSDRVERFFERHGFARVPPEALPARKWRDYASERRSRVRCLRLDL